MQPNSTLTEQEKAEVKKVARTLLEMLKREKLVLDWRKKQQARADIRGMSKNQTGTCPKKASSTLFIYDDHQMW